MRASGIDALDRAALEALRRWRFAPAIEHGRRIAARVVRDVAFRSTSTVTSTR